MVDISEVLLTLNEVLQGYESEVKKAGAKVTVLQVNGKDRSEIREEIKEKLDKTRVKYEQKPRLKAQTMELERLLKLANTPVPISLVSDNLTDVTLFRIGKLKRFNNKKIIILPGKYVAVGIRNGYRDVRVEFKVIPEQFLKPIEVMCKEEI